ncbi:MAG TPA: alpha/beta hydrolase [Phycisphaerae bacterium]|nr:alpha/beta hydrolase [Phycisphaerae bacterium]
MGLVIPTRDYRRVVFCIAAGMVLALAAALFGTPSGVLHAAAAPVFVLYVALVNRKWLGALSARHLVYALGLSLVVGAYLFVLMPSSGTLRVSWGELPRALWFLASVHVVVGLIDRLANRAFSLALRVPVGDRRPRGRAAARTLLRLGVLFAVAGPYLMATFLTHWVQVVESHDPGERLPGGSEKHGFTSTNGRKIAGWFVRSTDGPSDATALLLVGRSQPRAAALAYAEMLRACGCNVFLFDHGPEGSGAGRIDSLGVWEAHDVLGAVRWLREARPAESRCIFGLGVSDGATAVARAAALDGRIRAVVLDSAFAGGHPLLDGIDSLLPGPIAAYLRGATLAVASAELGCDLFDADLAATLGRLGPRPVLLVGGLADTVCPPQTARRLRAGAKGRASLWLVPGAGHAESLLRSYGEYRGRVESLFEAARGGLAAHSPNESGARGYRL